jgi:Ca2+-transporting ATPase
MQADRLLVRTIGALETAGSATVICANKTGIVTQNNMSVVAGAVGVHTKFARGLCNSLFNSPPAAGDFAVDQAHLPAVLPRPLRRLLNAVIALNSTAFRHQDPETGELTFVGNATDIALLKFAQELGWRDFNELRSSADVVEVFPFSSERQAARVVVKVDNRRWRLLLTGSTDALAPKCARHVVVRGDEEAEVVTQEIDDLARINILQTADHYGRQGLRTIALCFRDFESWPPPGPEASNATSCIPVLVKQFTYTLNRQRLRSLLVIYPSSRYLASRIHSGMEFTVPSLTATEQVLV